MPVPYSAEDLESVFDSRILTSSRFLAEMTDVTLVGETISGTNQLGPRWDTKITPVATGRRVSFAERECSCGELKCKHLAATALKALELFPVLRKAAPASLIDTIIPARDRPFQPAPSRPRPTGRRPRAAQIAPVLPDTPEPGATVLERAATPVLRLRRLQAPDEFGRNRMIDVLTLDFDYGGVRVDGADDTPFIRVKTAGQIAYIRRDTAAEATALDVLRPDNFVQMRVADGKSARGQRVLVFRGAEAAAMWHHFVAVRVPALTAQGWQSSIDANFGPQLADNVGM
ncbi:MAG: hypothetical protein POH28_15095, partial [Acidocella sp.]|nr:hypothetical protein [Acidocella sp.]